MRLPRQHKLDRMLPIGQDARQAVRIAQQKIGPLVSGEAAGKSQGQRIKVEDSLGRGDFFGRRSASGPIRVPGAGACSRSILSIRRFAVATDRCPEESRSCCASFDWVSAGTIRSAGALPKRVCFRRFPRAHVDSIGDVADWHFFFRPARENTAEQLPAHLAMQTADAIDSAATAHGQIRHVKRLRSIAGILAAQCQQRFQADSQFLRNL